MYTVPKYEYTESQAKNIAVTRDASHLNKVLRPIPARLQEDIHLHGTILGDFISLGDKPGGIEQGFLCYVRDKNYYQALSEILLDDKNGKLILPNNVDVKYDKALTRLYQQYKEKSQYVGVSSSNILTKNHYIQENIKFALEDLKKISVLESPKNLEELEILFSRNPVFFVIFSELIEEKNKLKTEDRQVVKWLIKLDFKDPAQMLSKIGINQVAPSARRTQKTTTAEKAGTEVKYFLLENNISESFAKKAGRRVTKIVAKAMNLGRWIKGSRLEQSISAIKEVIATKHASYCGMNSQKIQTINGTWNNSDGTPKVLTMSVWEKSFFTFDELNKEQEALKNLEKPIKKLEFKGGNNLSKSNYLCEENESGKWCSASHKIDNLGVQLVLFLRHGDRDAIGKKGQNKGIHVFTDSDGKQKVELFGIDFGKSFEIPKLRDSFRDDFTFEQPSNDDKKNLVNYAMFYDTPYSDRMVGVHLLAAQYGYPVPNEVKESFDQSDLIKNVEPGSHLKAFAEQIEYYKNLKKNNQEFLGSLKDRKLSKEEQKILKKEIENYDEIIFEIKKMWEISIKNDQKIIKVFEKRLCLTKNEVNFLDNLEKLGSPNSSIFSKNGEVKLNHIRVDRKDRVPVQFLLNKDNRPIERDGDLTLVVGGENASKKEFLDNIVDFLNQKLNKQEMEGIKIEVESGTLSFPKEKLNLLCQVCNEENIKSQLLYKDAKKMVVSYAANPRVKPEKLYNSAHSLRHHLHAFKHHKGLKRDKPVSKKLDSTGNHNKASPV